MKTNGYERIAYPETYTNEAELHSILTSMRKNDPVCWLEPENYTPFWAVTKHSDISEIELKNDFFINHPRTTLMDITAENYIKEFTGGSHLLVRTLVHMDNPDHKIYRSMTQSWFSPPNLIKLKKEIENLAISYVDKMLENGTECDFVKDIASLYPLRVIMTILGVPPEDESLMLKLTQQLFGGADEDMKRSEEESLDSNVIADFFNYFTTLTEDRRKNPTDDVATVIANANYDGKPIGHLEAMSYYTIIATAGHDTTSSSTAGGILALIENPSEFKKLKDDPSLMPMAIDETIRWVTPVKNFFRTATDDCIIGNLSLIHI